MSEKPDLVTFLTARYEEIEAATIYYRDRHPGLPCTNLDEYDSCSLHIAAAKATPYSNAEFGLADIAAKRLLLKLHRPHRDYPTLGCDTDNGIDSCGCTGGGPESEWPCETVKIMVAPFAQHPDYDPAWVIE